MRGSALRAGAAERAPALARMLPGVLLAALVAAGARLASELLRLPFDEVLVAILAGLLLANLVGLPGLFAPGLRLCSQTVLRVGVALLGARLTLETLAAIGAEALSLVVVAMAAALAATLLLGRALRIPARLALLIGVGTAVCGNSAIVATAPLLKADAREVGLAVATITLFGTMALFVYPLLGAALQLEDAAFGLWAGVAINDTSQVVAAGTAYSEPARDVATAVKLMRNALMAPLIVIIALWWPRTEAASTSEVGRGVRAAVPLFVVAFLLLAVLRTQGAITVEQAAVMSEPSKVFVLVALAAIGLQIRLTELRSVGPRPLLAGLAAAALLAVFTLTAIWTLGLAPRL